MPAKTRSSAFIEPIAEEPSPGEVTPTAFTTAVVEEDYPEVIHPEKSPPKTPVKSPVQEPPQPPLQSPIVPKQEYPFPKSPTIPINDLVLALKDFSDSAPRSTSTAGKLKEPEPFTGKDPKKLKAFLFQCNLYFRNSVEWDDSKRVNFAMSYLRDVAQEWFQPGFSGTLSEPPEWLEDWDAFVDELQTNFGPYDGQADAEHELTNLRMRDNQRISDYIVRFTSLALDCPWGDSALKYRFYEGLPARIKDELCKGEGKPRSLQEMRRRSQNIDARYWERTQERSREQQHQPKQTPQKSSVSSSSSSAPSGSYSKPAEQKGVRTNPSGKAPPPKVDLTGKLDSKGRLTQKERQARIDKNLCLFCGKGGHRVTECTKAKASTAKARAASAASKPAKAPKAKESGSEKKKD
jgi:Retrotransposon gag protein